MGIRKSAQVAIIAVFLLLLFPLAASADDGERCQNCHSAIGDFPAVVDDWEQSKHAESGISCSDCHTAEPTDPDATEHNGFYISPVVSPNDCATCHEKEVAENAQSLHALGAKYYEVDFYNQKLPYLESEITLDGYSTASHNATVNGCQGCHGTNMTGKSTDDPAVWPNNGIGRINPDGSLGSCASCHTRHKFSVEEARKPESCEQCHLGPDHPQTEIYLESKHGAIYNTEGDEWNWDADDWKPGEDYRTPTCAACHMSGTDELDTTHDVGARLSWELETPVSRKTDNVANILGTPIGDGSTWEEKRESMQSVCLECHSEDWVLNYYENGDAAVELYNKKYADSKAIVDELYEEGLLTEQAFDEPIEFKIYEVWHHEGRRARMGAFMFGPDFVQWHGFYELLKDKAELVEMAEQIRLNAELQEQLGLEDTGTQPNEETAATPGFGITLAIAGILAGLFIFLKSKK
ncbi:cytochrome c553 [Methanohalophilus levihalophilus]|uniref:multiheme c-type cytochrome n=1 Tax=Methanohalophilus levihalophilus TaxID=1431282 RepID=UPI001AE1884C|nr:multiheme c-type cytochrome [Methanohalophilus levihalophilus]MBP2030941.1 cytochrome c553 [Methanohalophilus levihalophilus]